MPCLPYQPTAKDNVFQPGITTEWDWEITLDKYDWEWAKTLLNFDNNCARLHSNKDWNWDVQANGNASCLMQRLQNTDVTVDKISIKDDSTYVTSFRTASLFDTS